jgi:hypothetical protein
MREIDEVYSLVGVLGKSLETRSTETCRRAAATAAAMEAEEVDTFA